MVQLEFQTWTWNILLLWLAAKIALSQRMTKMKKVVKVKIIGRLRTILDTLYEHQEASSLFHQHFMSSLFTQKCFALFLCTYSLRLYFFGKRKSGNPEKAVHKLLVKLTTGVCFSNIYASFLESGKWFTMWEFVV